MADELNQTTQETPETPGGDEGETFDAAYVTKLRQEAASWRSKLRDAEGKLKDLTPKAEEFEKLTEAQKSAEQKLSEQLAKMQAELDRRTVESEASAKRAAVLKMAIKVGADPDVVELLDLSRLDLTDEETTMATLAKLAPAARAAGGNTANPGRNGANAKETDGELKDRFFGGGRSSSKIFGG